MAYADLGEARLFYVMDGPAQAQAPVVVLSNSLGTNADMWALQVPALARHFRVLRYDTRGHGKSSVPAGDYRIEQLARDVDELLTHLDIARAHFCGLSMGGPTGMALALAKPERVSKLVLCNTGARIGQADGWKARIDAVGNKGLESMAGTLIERWLTPAFRSAEPGRSQVLIDMLRRTPDAGYIANCAALRDADLRDRIGAIRVPTLVIAGTHDVAATPQDGRDIQAAIPHARYVELPASHLSNWEMPGEFNRELLDFLLE